MATLNDIVLIHLEDAPVSFARVESILPDAKKDWYHIKLLMLQVPLQVVTWILKDSYINGEEFHMNGKRMRLVKVETPVEETDKTRPETRNEKPSENKNHPESKNQSNVVSFAEFKKD